MVKLLVRRTWSLPKLDMEANPRSPSTGIQIKKKKKNKRGRIFHKMTIIFFIILCCYLSSSASPC
jgi:hypothetical protein